MKRIISLDIETTGLYPKKGDKIVEIGCVEIINNEITDNKYHVYINPKIPMPEDAFKIHGISDSFLKDFSFFEDIVSDFLEFVKDDIVIAHNARFDIGFLNFELSAIGKKELSYDRVIDTLSLARKKFPKQKVSLDTLCERYSISLAGREKHSAIVDACLLANLYPNLIEIKQLGMILEARNKVNDFSGFDCNFVYPRGKEKEILHENFVKRIKNPIWND